MQRRNRGARLCHRPEHAGHHGLGDRIILYPNPLVTQVVSPDIERRVLSWARDQRPDILEGRVLFASNAEEAVPHPGPPGGVLR